MKMLKAYRIPLGMIAIGAGLIALVWKVSIKWIAAPVFLAGGILILLGLIMAGKIAEAHVRVKYPEYDEPIGETGAFECILHYGGFAALVSVFVVFKLVDSIFDNTIGGASFFFICAGAGIGVALLFYAVLKKAYPAFMRPNRYRQSALFGYYFAVTAWTIFGMTIMDISGASSRTEKVLVLEKSKNIRHGTPFLFLQINGKRERFVPKKKEWNKIQEQDSIYITILEGRLGFDLVTGFHQENPDVRIKQPQTIH